VFTLDPDIAGQPAQPFWREAAPHYQTDERSNHTDNHDQFSHVAHDSKSCAKQPDAQA
jgi:hypothetical protein